MKLFLWALLSLALLAPRLNAAEENLDEMFNRKLRRAANAWPTEQLEDAANYYIWQPETIMYKDITTGREVWRMINGRGSSTYFSDIGQNAWSADGKYLRLSTTGRQTSAYNNFRDNIYQGQMITRSDGNSLRFLVNGPSRVARSGGSEFWSPQIAGTYYEFGNGWMGATGTGGVLYRVSVTDTSETKIPILTFPSDSWYWGYSKFMSADGRRIIAGTDEVTLYPAIIYPDSQAQLEDADGYVSDRHLGLYGGMNGGSLTSFHDQYMGGDGSWYYIMPNDPDSTANWWRIKTSGSSPDGGALCDNSDFPVTDIAYNFGECWPENHGTVKAGNYPSPFVQSNPYNPALTGYWSHFVPDRWGRLALFTNVVDSLPKGYGPGVWDIQNHEYIVPSFGGGAQHHDWKGFTDYIISSSPGTPDGTVLDYSLDKIFAAKYNDENSRYTVCYTHTRYDNGTSYNSLTRPAQSPDGTKAGWHSEFLNGTDNVDIFWAVVYYPYPPADLSAVYSGGIKIGFLPAKYTERGWPYAPVNPDKNSLVWPLLDGNGNEIGEPLYAREIKSYHVWRSVSQDSGWQEIGSVDAQYSSTYAEDSTMFMLHPVVNGLKVSPSNKLYFTDNPGDGVWYYAVTSEEHSGLESDELSEVIRVTVAGSNVAGQIVAAKGQKDFWRQMPANPSGFTYAAQSTAGHYQLSWTNPSDSKIRYYNIYYSNTGIPELDQQHRIASVPKETNRYLDWLADPSAAGYYRITSVDRYGNENTGDTITGRPAPPTGFAVQ